MYLKTSNTKNKYINEQYLCLKQENSITAIFENREENRHHKTWIRKKSVKIKVKKMRKTNDTEKQKEKKKQSIKGY